MSNLNSGKKCSHTSNSVNAPNIIMAEPSKTLFNVFKQNGLSINSLMEYINKEVTDETSDLDVGAHKAENAMGKSEDFSKCILAAEKRCDPVLNSGEKLFLIHSMDDKERIDLRNNIAKVVDDNSFLCASDDTCNTAEERQKPDNDHNKQGGGEDSCTDILPFIACNVKLIKDADLACGTVPNPGNLTDFSKLGAIKFRDIDVEEIKLETKNKSCPSNVSKKGSCSSIFSSDQDFVSSFTNRLNESYHIQERLATENKILESSKYQLEERILTNEGECEKLQNQVDLLTNGMRELKEHATCVSKCIDNNNKKEDSNSQILSEAIWLEKETKRLYLDLDSLKTERDALVTRKACVKSWGCLDTPKVTEEQGPELNTALMEIKQLRQECNIIKEQLDKTLEENKNLIKMESELELSKAEVAKNMEEINETNAKLQGLVAEKKLNNEEMDDMRSILDDQLEELQEYRKKYLQAQQRVEELNCELNEKQTEIVSMRRESDEEIRIAKVLYQEKLAGIDAITATMKETQMKLYQYQQQKLLLEAGIEGAKRELDHVTERNVVLQKTIEEEKQKLGGHIVEIEERFNQTRKENAELQSRLARMDEAFSHLEVRLAEKTKEAAEATKFLEEAKQDSLRQMNRIKERSESSRRNLQIQLAENERELAGARAAVKSAHKERDEIRHKLQSQINTLTENLEEGQKRWKGLHAHVSALQSSLSPNSSSTR